MYEFTHRESDGDTSLHPTNSSTSSMSSDSASSSRLSFDLNTVTVTTNNNNDNNNNNMVIKPHRSSDLAFKALTHRITPISLRDFRLIRRIGSGDIGTVFLCVLKDQIQTRSTSSHYYAMKVVDREALAARKKLERAENERNILKMLDHPFLPTLYAEFQASNFSSVVMEYCSGGDLHSLRHKLPLKRFSISSARFYAAEVLVALEYLHMLGIIYRDLKPENVLVRSDGHVMLSDFDLSLCSDPILTVESPSSSPHSPYTHPHTKKSFSRMFHHIFRSKRVQTLNSKPPTDRTFVAEPVTARSESFVGTHEYVAPEVASGGSHGNAVDWWAFGVFIYELIYGLTPFAAQSNEITLRNIVKKPLSFPTHAPSSPHEFHARDLISKLLTKDPTKRLGRKRGSADVKTHPFFEGLNFALIRTVKPPEVPCLRRQKTTPYYQGARKNLVFDYF